MATPRSTLAVCFTALIVMGVLSGALGPLVPVLAAHLGVGVDRLGALFTALFVGALSCQLAGGWLNERFGLKAMVLAGIALMATGLSVLALAPTLPLILAGACLAGCGQGLLDASTNVLVVSVYDPRRAVAAVNVLHFAFGAGAVASPIATTFALERLGSPMPALWVAVALAVALFAVGTRALLDPPVAPHVAESGGAGLYRAPALWTVSALLFLYVGIEMGVGGWTTVYLERTTALAPGPVASILSGYWLALTAGRLVGAALGARLGARGLTALSVAGSIAGAALVVLGGGNAALSAAGTLLLGLSFGPIFPSAVVLATELFPAAQSRAVAFVIGMSSLGGMLLPPLQGFLLARVSPLASVLQVLAAAALMAVALAATRRRREVAGAAARAA